MISGSLEELIKHGLRALRDTLPAEVELTNKVKNLTAPSILEEFSQLLRYFCFLAQNCSLAVVGKGTSFTIYDNAHIDQFLALIEGEERSPGAGKQDDEEVC